MRMWLIILAVIVVFAAAAWATDTITLQGERTVYTVECMQGEWQGQKCTGQLVAADRFRFRALKVHREVLFWRLGVAEASSRFTDCEIEDGRNWRCKPNADAGRSITLAMLHGQPVVDPEGKTRAFHAVEKWRWWLLRWGMPMGSQANG